MPEREKRNAYRILAGNLKERDSLEDLSIDGTVILKRALKEHNGMVWSNFIWLKTGKAASSFQQGHRTLVSLNARNILTSGGTSDFIGRTLL
jgi:hypothetical protein